MMQIRHVIMEVAIRKTKSNPTAAIYCETKREDKDVKWIRIYYLEDEDET